MNLYGIDAGEQQTVEYEDFSVMAGHYEYWRAIDIIPASSRGQARATFCAQQDLDYLTPMRIIMLEKDFQYMSEDDDDTDYWMIFNAKLEPEKFDEIVWQAEMDYANREKCEAQS